MKVKDIMVFTALIVLLSAGTASSMMKSRSIKKEPALVLAAFGTTTRAMVTFDFFEEQLRMALPDKYKDLRIEWAFTSEIVRERANNKFRKAGINRRFRSLAQVVSDLEDEGYRKIFIQPLHIFPGIEYRHLKEMVQGLEETFREFYLTIRVGYPLLAHWEWVKEVVDALEPDLLKEDEGCNVLAAHGTWDTSDGANITYLGLEKMLKERYDNVFIGAIEGIPTRTMALDSARRCTKKRIRFIPFMFVAGDHIMNDIMGEEPSKGGEVSWALELKREGFAVEALKIKYKGVELFKSLGLNSRVNEIFINNIIKGLGEFN